MNVDCEKPHHFMHDYTTSTLYDFLINHHYEQLYDSIEGTSTHMLEAFHSFGANDVVS